MHQRLLRVSMMVMILLELITKTVLQSLPLQENFKNKTKEEKGSIFLQRERGQKQPQGHPIKLHRCLWPSEWYSMSNPPDRKYNSLKTQPSRTMNIQIVKRLVLSYSCITGPGITKVNTRKWTQIGREPHSTQVESKICVSQNWKPVSTQYTSTDKHTG